MIAGNIVALDPGTRDLGWPVVAPYTGRVLELGVVHQDLTLAKSTDRQARVRVQGVLCRELVRRHRVTAIVAEAASFNPRRFVMAVGLCMSIGALTGVAAAQLAAIPASLRNHARGRARRRRCADGEVVQHAQEPREVDEDRRGEACPGASGARGDARRVEARRMG